MAVLRMLAQKGMFWITDTFTRNSCLNAKLLLAALAICFIGRTIYLLYFAPLSKLPGSALAKLTMLPIKLDALLGRLGDACERDYYKYGDIYVVGPNAVVLNNPVDCRTVLGTHRFIKSSMYKEFALIDDTMFTTQSAELTHVRRRQVGPAFTYGYLNEMEPTILDCGIHAIKRKWDGMLLQKGEATVEYSLHFSLTTFDIIGALGYGQRFNALEQDSSQIVDWVNNYNRLAVLGIVFPYLRRFPFSLMVRDLLKSKMDFVEFGNNAAESRREMLRAGKAEKPKDLLQALIDGEDPESRVRMTGSQITAENIGFLIGGTDTTSLTMSWTLHYLLLYPNAYRKAVSEVRGKFARDHTITYAQGKAHLPYVDACIHEAMRIRAVSGVFLPRIVPRGGATFQGHYLPEGTQVGVNIAGANHHQGTWDNPQRFAPERFIVDERAKQNVITFSSGVRICPGRNLAMYEMMTILANLLKDYDFELPSDAIFRPERLDGLGNPVVMPRKHSLTVVPKYPERDCRVIIRHAVW